MHGALVSGDVLVHESVAVVIDAVRELLVDEVVAVVVDAVARPPSALVRHAHVVDGGVLLPGNQTVRLLQLEAVQHSADTRRVVSVAERVHARGDGQCGHGVLDIGQMHPVGVPRLAGQRQAIQ